MLRTLLGVSVLLSMSACKYDNSGIFIAYMPLLDDLTCTTTVTENITDSQVPEEGTISGSLVHTEAAEQSDAIVLVQIFEAKDKVDDGDILIDWGGNIFPATRDGKVITGHWLNSNDSTESDVDNDAGYTFTYKNVSSTDNTVTLTKNSETGGYSVAWKVETVLDATWTESDEWDPSASYGYYSAPYNGQINSPISYRLEGTGSNNYDTTDCDQDPCQIRVQDNCSGSFPAFDLHETSLDIEDMPSVEGDGQPNGN